MPAKKWTKHHREAFAKTVAEKRENRIKSSPIVQGLLPVPLDVFRSMDAIQLQRFVESFPKASALLIRQLLQ